MKRQKTAKASAPVAPALPATTTTNTNAVAGSSTKAASAADNATASSSKKENDPKEDARIVKVRTKGIFDAYVPVSLVAFYANGALIVHGILLSLKKSCKAEKWWGKMRKVKWDEHYNSHDFWVVFGRNGWLTQPLPNNKVCVHQTSRSPALTRVPTFLVVGSPSLLCGSYDMTTKTRSLSSLGMRTNQSSSSPGGMRRVGTSVLACCR